MGAFGTGAHDIVPTRPRRPHDGEQELAEGKIDVGKFDDFHATPVLSLLPSKKGGGLPHTLPIAGDPR